MAGGFRSRLILTVIALVAGTVVLLATTSFLLVRASLRSQLIHDAVAQVEFNLVVLATEDQLPAGGGREAFERSGLSERFLTRGSTGVFVDFGDDDPYASAPSLLEAPGLVGADFAEIVARGEIAYEFLDRGDTVDLVVGAERPPGGPVFLFVFPAGELDLALARLAGYTAGAGIVVTLVGALTARYVAGRVLRPVRSAVVAAEQVGAGDLTARVPVESDDEFGRWAEEFNAMASSLELKVGELEEAERRERRFVADVSHELRTPLTGLVNEAELLAAHLEEMPAATRRPAELLVADVGRLRRLVEDLLEISRLDAGAADAVTSITDLPRLLAALARDRHPEARLETAGLSRYIVCDRLGIERVVGNLLDNARVHAPGAAVTIRATLDRDLLAIQVIDNGPGLPDVELERVFDRFTTMDRARAGGSGLGLAIARGHARRMGGDLTARPVSGGGMVFELLMPVTESLPVGDETERSPIDDGGGNRNPARRIP
jgi:two-component system sensor histidine kinase MtrB